MKKGLGKNPASAAEPGESSCTTPCLTSQASDFAATIASRYPFARTATVVAMASMELAERMNGGGLTDATPPPSRSGFGGRL